MRDQAVPGHNRWHPDVPSVAKVRPGQEFRVECREWTDAQLKNSDSANDVRDADLSVAHMLSGPIEVEGAEPGDLLVVEILDLGPCQPPEDVGEAPGQGWGYTGIFAKSNGGGFLTDYFPDAYKAIWDFHGIYATSRHIPGVKYAGITHPGLFGTAPSADLLAKWNHREQQLIDSNPNRVPPLALPPLQQGVHAGRATGSVAEKIAREGARTVPCRENGGNHDIKNFTRGARVYYPVWVPGAKFSGGDLHFSQGDGEITFCGAIEMGGYIDFGVELIKGGMTNYGQMANPIFFPGPAEPRYSTFLSFIGFSVENDQQCRTRAPTRRRVRHCRLTDQLRPWPAAATSACREGGAGTHERLSRRSRNDPIHASVDARRRRGTSDTRSGRYRRVSATATTGGRSNRFADRADRRA